MLIPCIKTAQHYLHLPDEHRSSVSWWIFLVSGLGVIVIALITLSVQTICTAMANPVKSLNTEKELFI